jgi:urea transporter
MRARPAESRADEIAADIPLRNRFRLYFIGAVLASIGFLLAIVWAARSIWHAVSASVLDPTPHPAVVFPVAPLLLVIGLAVVAFTLGVMAVFASTASRRRT